MKVYEVLASSRFLLATMNRNGVSADDIMYLDMFYEYRDMLAEGRKETEIRDFLANKHKLSASTIKRIIKRLNDGKLPILGYPLLDGRQSAPV